MLSATVPDFSIRTSFFCAFKSSANNDSMPFQAIPYKLMILLSVSAVTGKFGWLEIGWNRCFPAPLRVLADFRDGTGRSDGTTDNQ
jgi:hypothetical protein